MRIFKEGGGEVENSTASLLQMKLTTLKRDPMASHLTG